MAERWLKFKTEHYFEALSQFKQGIALDRSQWKIDGLEQLGYCAIQNNDRQQADQAFTTLFKYDATKRKKVSQMAQLYQHKGDNKIADYLLNIAKQ